MTIITRRSKTPVINTIGYVMVVSGILSYKTVGSHSTALLKNPSFESPDTEPWILSERSAMSTFSNSTADNIRVQSGVANSGSQALALGPYQAEPKHNALVCSQYVTVGCAEGRDALELSLWIRGTQRDAQQLVIMMDISYEDNDIFNVEFHSGAIGGSDEKGSFWRVCKVVPSYGCVRALMLHIVVEHSLAHTLYIDDVQLDVGGIRSPHCQTYTASFPKRRETITNFLSPSMAIDECTTTLATHLTTDRLTRLEELVDIWQGPTSATIFLLCSPVDCHKELEVLVLWFYSHALVSKYVTVHLVFQDFVNAMDAILYPANYLRNIALANVLSQYVFLIDVDFVPNSTSDQLTIWVEEAEEILNDCLNCVFVAPVFHVQNNNFPHPRSKTEIKYLLDTHAEILDTAMGATPSAVRYRKWLNTDELYEISFNSEMEPYFVTRSDVPLMNDMFAGYGRDKCAYGKDLHHAGYTFHVLPNAFVVNKPPLPGSLTMYNQDQELHLGVFLNMLFQEKDVRTGYIWSRSMYSLYGKLTKNLRARSSLYERNTAMNHGMYTERTNGDSIAQVLPRSVDFTENNNYIPMNTPLESEYIVHCLILPLGQTELFSSSNRKSDQQRHRIIPDNRLDIVIREMFQYFGTFTYIELPSLQINSLLKVILPFMHPDSVIAIKPNSEETFEANDADLWYTYHFETNISFSLSSVFKGRNGPATILVRVGNINGDTSGFIMDVINISRNTDLIILDQPSKITSPFLTYLCRLSVSWKVYDISGFTVLKTDHLVQRLKLEVPPETNLHGLQHPPMCTQESTTTDLILMTKDRPLQTLAFLESLSLTFRNVDTIWILLRSDNPHISEAYDVVLDCFKAAVPSIQINVVPEVKGQFGSKLLSILTQTTAHFIVLCVDEIIWMKPIDLTYVSCLLNVDDKIASFQLRVGHNYGQSKKDGMYEDRFVPLYFDKDIQLYYPRYHTGDLGYVTNVDGTLMRRSDLLDDLREILKESSQPLSMEMQWVSRKTHVRSRQWHLMYTESRLVNNMVLADGQVALTKVPSNESMHLANMIISNRTKIDVKHFIDTYKNRIRSTHSKFAVRYTDMLC